MPNLDGLGLQNFRTFHKKEQLEFASITVITGANNSGKSSLFKAIQLLIHNYKLKSILSYSITKNKFTMYQSYFPANILINLLAFALLL
jgi:AAA15 family ATPase/GTPase